MIKPKQPQTRNTEEQKCKFQSILGKQYKVVFSSFLYPLSFDFSPRDVSPFLRPSLGYYIITVIIHLRTAHYETVSGADIIKAWHCPVIPSFRTGVCGGRVTVLIVLLLEPSRQNGLSGRQVSTCFKIISCLLGYNGGRNGLSIVTARQPDWG